MDIKTILSRLPIAIPFTLTIGILLIPGAVYAGTSQIIRTQTQYEFLEGSFEAVEVDPSGCLTPGRQLSMITDQALDDMICSFAADSSGQILAGTARQGLVFRQTRSGFELMSDTDEAAVLALCVDRKGVVYAGTAPSGKIMKINPDGTVKEFYKTDSHYVWDMEWMPDDRLWIAFGDPGQIACLDREGGVLRQWRTKSQHVRTMLRVGNDLWFGTSDPGCLYQIKGNDVRLVYDCKETEITSIVCDAAGSIYFSAVASPALKLNPSSPATAIQPNLDSKGNSEKNTVYRVSRDGLVESWWSTSAVPVFCLGILNDRPLAVCGRDSMLFRIDAAGQATFMGASKKATATQFLSLKGIPFLGTSCGRILRLDPGQSTGSCAESKIFRFDTQADWGRLFLYPEKNANRHLTVSTRSGNRETPDDEWSEWREIEWQNGSGKIMSPPGRFFQWKAVFGKNDGRARIDAVEFSVQVPNRPPRIREITVYPISRGTFADQPGGMGKIFRQELPDGTKVEYQIRMTSLEDSLSKKLWFKLRGMRTLAWSAEDPDSDSLVYRLDITSEGSNNWTVIETEAADPVFSFDSAAFPDGRYLIRVTASDIRGNPFGTELTAELISSPFTIDNSPPEIRDLSATASTATSRIVVRIAGRAIDRASRMKQMEYSFDAYNWFSFTSIDCILDDREEAFEVPVPVDKTPGRVFLRVTDEQENTASEAVDVEGIPTKQEAKGD